MRDEFPSCPVGYLGQNEFGIMSDTGKLNVLQKTLLLVELLHHHFVEQCK